MTIDATWYEIHLPDMPGLLLIDTVIAFLVAMALFGRSGDSTLEKDDEA